MLKEFREFITRGNVIDLAVAVIIGAAFGQITTSLVNQVIMPPLGLLIGGVDFSNLGFILKDADQYATVADAVAAGAPVIQIGAFLNTLINFLIIAFVIFMVVRAYNQMLKRFAKKEAAAPAAPAAPPADVQLLTEIRDLLKQRAG
jgi:large conductance mechanosensitive channel